jgi:hypothetical protein
LDLKHFAMGNVGFIGCSHNGIIGNDSVSLQREA